MKTKFIGFLVIINFGVGGFALGQKQGYVWYFSRELGLDFNTTPPIVLMDGQISGAGTEGGTEGSGSIASANGKLLFYANAQYIWNREHEIMQNGDGLMGQVSSTHGAVIVPVPCENAQYYVFTTDAWHYGIPMKMGYSVVDVCGDNGYGEILVDQKNIVLLDSAGEKLAVTQHSNGVDYWLVAHKHFSNAFYTYLITKEGISPPVISKIGTVHGNLMYQDDLRGYQDAIGQMKISPDGSKLALVMENRKPDVIELFNFDNSSGVLTEYKNLSDGTESVGIYGVAFSPNGSKLYVNGRYGLFQFTLDAGSGTQQEIIASKYRLGDHQDSGGLQLGPDGKIYVPRGFYAGIIQNPDLQGEGCNFIDNAIHFSGRFVHYGFPTFIDNFNYFDKGAAPFGVFLDDAVNLCTASTIDLRNHTSGDNLTYLWEDGSTEPVYHFPTPGDYQVTISDRFCSAVKKITIAPPFDVLGSDTTSCEGDTLLLVSKLSDATYQWENGSTEASLPVYIPGIYRLTATKNNCAVRDSVKVAFRPLPKFTLGNDTTLCEDDTLVLLIEVQADEFIWQDGSASDSYAVTKAGKYSATAIHDGCFYSDDVLIQYAVRPKIDLGADTLLCTGSALKIELDPNLLYHWNDGSTNSSLFVNQPVNLWVTAIAGKCSSSDSLEVNFVNCGIQLPNFFSPNDDQYNPYLIPSDMSGITSAQISVYNRWGIELYHTDNFSSLTGWDGTYQNEPLSSGVYFWKVEYTDIEKKVHTIKGTVTLQR